MTLPPGRHSVSVPGLDASVDPQLTEAAGELAAWVDYLLHPQDNDGPRYYRATSNGRKNPLSHRNEDLDGRTNEYETVPILDEFVHDPDAFVRPVQAIAGHRHELISETYDKLVKGYFTWSHINRGPGKGAITDFDYDEVSSARFDWFQMRMGWSGSAANAAMLYEESFILFQVVTENCFYVVAEHLARYWGILDKAGRDMLELMNAFTNECSVYEAVESSDGIVLDFASIVLSAVIAATATVLTGGVGLTVAAVLQSAASEAVSKALTQATSGHGDKHRTLNKYFDLQDTAKHYLDGIKAIERETADAVSGLALNLREARDHTREHRRYEIGRETGKFSEEIPHVADFK